MSANTRITLVMLPGLDGTGRLFEPLIGELPEWVDVKVIAYPADRKLSYSQLVTYVGERIPKGRPFVLLAESFSGPVAIELAASEPTGLKGLVLCCTFSKTPLPWLLRLFVMLPFSFLVGLSLPAFLLRKFLIGDDAPEALVKEVGETVKSVYSSVLAHRLREVARVDKGALLKGIKMPVCVIQADDDMLVPNEAAKPLVELSGAEVDIIEGPHMLLQTRPRRAAEVISKFYDKLEGIQ